MIEIVSECTGVKKTCNKSNSSNFRFEKSKRGITLRILREIFEIQKSNRFIMPSTMSKLDDDWSINTPPRKHTPKRQKLDTDLKIKLSYPKQSTRDDHTLHVLFMQAIMSVNDHDIKVLNKRGEALKESAIADLMNASFHKNHFNTNLKYTGSRDDRKAKIVIVHRIRGFSSVGNMKKENKVMDFLKLHSAQITSHEWLEEDWDTKVVGFFTQVYPSCMTNEYATKVVTNYFGHLKSKAKAPPLLRLQSIPMRVDLKTHSFQTRVFGLEVKSSDVRNMMEATKTAFPPGTFVPFQLRSTNEEAFQTAIKHIASKNENTWTIKVNYVSEGAFFKLEDRVKTSLLVEHVTYDSVNQAMRILVPKAKFNTYRAQLKENLQKWSCTLDPDDTRLFDTNPEVSYLPRDDVSTGEDSYASRSIISIMSLEIDEIAIVQDRKETPPTTVTTPSEITEPSFKTSTSEARSEIEELRAEVRRNQEEMIRYVQTMEKFQAMLETILRQVGHLSTPQASTGEHVPPLQDRRHRDSEQK